jgi:hypothetical protein
MHIYIYTFYYNNNNEKETFFLNTNLIFEANKKLKFYRN